MKNQKAKRILKIIGIVLAAAAALGLTVWAVPYVLQLRDPQKRQAFADFLSSLGPWGVIFLFVLQLLQIIIAVIPGEPIEIISGVICGTFGGLLLCLAGIALGGACVFLLVKRFGMRFVNKFVNSKAFDKLKFLHNPTKRDIFLFILFFIPGTPKDILTYFAPFTGVELKQFILISVLARIPSVISSTYVGASITKGNLWLALGVFALTAVIGLVGIVIYNKIIEAHNK